MNPQPAPLRLRRQGLLEGLVHGVALSVFSILAVPAILGGNKLSAQKYARPPINLAQQQRAVTKHTQQRHRAAAHAGMAPIEPRPAPEAIAAPAHSPPAPGWPANQPPNQAKVSWDGRSLEIEASNSSLNQILHQVAADMGAKLEGLAQDQRIFGTYGPGPARNVLLKLLEGFGYNVLMIGGRDSEAPLEVVSFVSSPANLQTAANNRNRSNPKDDDADPPPEAPRPPSMETPFGNGDSEKPENPQQIMQDILDRQQKIDQQQKSQQNNPQQ